MMAFEYVRLCFSFCFRVLIRIAASSGIANFVRPVGEVGAITKLGLAE